MKAEMQDLLQEIKVGQATVVEEIRAQSAAIKDSRYMPPPGTPPTYERGARVAASAQRSSQGDREDRESGPGSAEKQTLLSWRVDCIVFKLFLSLCFVYYYFVLLLTHTAGSQRPKNRSFVLSSTRSTKRLKLKSMIIIKSLMRFVFSLAAFYFFCLLHCQDTSISGKF